MRVFFLAMILLCPLMNIGYAQNTNDISLRGIDSVFHKVIMWQATSMTDLATGRQVPTETKIITYKLERVEWVQNDGSYSNLFVITGLLDKSDHSPKESIVKFSLIQNEVSGIMEVLDVDGEIQLIMNLSTEDEAFLIKYVISSIQTL
jgi:hypothetical protein